MWLLGALLLGCESRPDSISHEEYLVFSCLIDDVVGTTPANGNVYISDSTFLCRRVSSSRMVDSTRIIEYHDPGIGNVAPPLDSSFQQVWPELAIENYSEAFGKINGRRYFLDVASITSHVQVHTMKNDPPVGINESLSPGHLFWFSRVVINRTKSDAVVYMEHICGPLCGAGQWSWLKKVNGKWVVHKTLVTWVS